MKYFPHYVYIIFTAYGNRVKFDSTVSKIIPSSNSPSSQVIDQCYDQGYGSERSPEDEVLPPLPLAEQQYGTMVVNSMPQGLLNTSIANNTNQMFVEMEYGQKFQQQQHYDFITEGKRAYVCKLHVIWPNFPL